MLASSKLIGEPNKKKMNCMYNLCCHTCGGHSGAVLVLVQLLGDSTFSSDSICFHSNGLDLILKEHTCLNKAVTLVAQIRAKLRSMRSKELHEELRDKMQQDKSGQF